jgi:hypothetical protein
MYPRSVFYPHALEEYKGADGFRQYSFNIKIGQEEHARLPFDRPGMAQSDEDNLKLLPSKTEEESRKHLTERVSKRKLKQQLKKKKHKKHKTPEKPKSRSKPPIKRPPPPILKPKPLPPQTAETIVGAVEVPPPKVHTPPPPPVKKPPPPKPPPRKKEKIIKKKKSEPLYSYLNTK